MNQRQFDASIKSHVRELLYCAILSPFSVWKFEVFKLNLNNVGVSSDTKLYLLGCWYASHCQVSFIRVFLGTGNQREFDASINNHVRDFSSVQF